MQMIRQTVFSLCLLVLTGSLCAQEGGQEPTPATATTQLLHEAGQLFGEIQELAVELEIARQPPPRDQLLVLVSLLPDERFELEAVQVKINGDFAAFHEYSAAEIEALAKGGAHRLLLKRLPAGRHELVARWVGKAHKAKEEEMVREIRWAFRSGETRRVIELELSQGEEQSLPHFSLREWN
ncbi:hypothetical protein MNBD_GAMMA20-1554 [hydrothermal vent metagenome]|uniref:AraC family transcriptional regulator n=1 Tax=hydrothermal vent metagenome TaxID=652676 RepID=A0A3B1AAI8_9ZZZZ